MHKILKYAYNIRIYIIYIDYKYHIFKTSMK